MSGKDKKSKKIETPHVKAVKSALKKYGGYNRTVKCQGCGGTISEEYGNLESVEYAVNKRHGANFWHRGCMEHVWEHGIV